MNIYLTLALLWLGHFLVDFMISVFPVYKTMANMDLGMAGIIAGGCALLGEGSQLLFGEWSDRGYRRLLIAFGIFAACAALGVVYCQSAWMMFPCLLVCYLGSAAFHPSAASLVSRLSVQSKALFMTIFASGGSFGLAAGQIGFYLAYMNLGNLIALIVIPSLFLALIVAFCRFPEVKRTTPRTPVSLLTMGKLFQQRDLRLLYITLACNTTVFFGFMFLLPDLLVSRGYPDWICFGGGHLATILGGATMMVPSGMLADRYSARTVILGSMVLGLGCFYLFLLTPQLSAPVILILLFVLGSLSGIVHPVGVSLANQFLPTHPGLVSAFAMGMVWCVAESLGPASSMLTRLFTPQDATTNALLILASLNVVGSITALKLPKSDAPQIILEIA